MGLKEVDRLRTTKAVEQTRWRGDGKGGIKFTAQTFAFRSIHLSIYMSQRTKTLSLTQDVCCLVRRWGMVMGAELSVDLFILRHLEKTQAEV